MKNLFSTMAVAATLFAGYSAYNTHKEIKLTDVALANVEALAEEEVVQPDINNCIYDKKLTCIALHPTDPSKDKEKANAKWP